MRSAVVSLLTAVGLLLGLSPGAPATAVAGDTRPNVIIILTDDMRADDLAWMPTTYSLFADGGVSFDQAVSPHPLCCPARAEIMSGQYGHNNGVKHNQGKVGGYQALRDKDNTVATWMQTAGYSTGFVGKWLNGTTSADPTPSGWDDWQALVGAGVTDYFTWQFHGEEPQAGYVTNEIEARTNNLIRRFAQVDQPFFLMSNHVAPHDRQSKSSMLVPAPAESQFAQTYQGVAPPILTSPAFNVRVIEGLPKIMPVQQLSNSYYSNKWFARVRALLSVDEAVASMVTTLQETGEWENTVLLFASDNGYNLGEHRLYRKNMLTEESLRVPLLMVGPGIPAGSHVQLPTSLVDIAATVVDYGMATPGRVLDGQSLRGLATTGSDPSRRDTTLIQVSHDYEVNSAGWAMRGVVTSDFIYGRSTTTGERVLFDLARDPYGLVNYATDPRYAKVLDDLDGRFQALADCAGAACNRRFGAAAQLLTRKKARIIGCHDRRFARHPFCHRR